MKTILKITNLTKEYEKVVALKDVSLEIEKGTIFGLLGPNGAGKTSLIRILTGITIPDQGSFTLDYTDNKDFESLSRMIGYLPEERGLYNDMKVIEQLEFFGKIKGLKRKEARERIDFYSDRVGIKDWYQKKAKELSKGMQQMVQFTATIFYEPNLIILDEPFTGLDPLNSNKMIQEIHELQKKGITIIFSTHRLEQVEEICEDIALINKGQVILAGQINKIKREFKKGLFKINYSKNINTSSELPISSQDEAFINDLEDENFEIIQNTPIISSDNEERDFEMIIKCKNPDISSNTIIKRLMEKIEIHSFIEILPSLSEIFIEQVNKFSNQSLQADDVVLQDLDSVSQEEAIDTNTQEDETTESIEELTENSEKEVTKNNDLSSQKKKNMRFFWRAVLIFMIVYFLFKWIDRHINWEFIRDMFLREAVVSKIDKTPSDNTINTLQERSYT
ncbi:MAG: ATP-binding cassette domain-containing protein [Candidatus Cloacimonetes bacterium]|nr:ATP-binding cassette domain-containing protein [Candidatus Cloacimonadota bacterium]